MNSITGIGSLSDVVRWHWRLILAMTVAVSVLVASWSTIRPPSYSASARVALGSSNPDDRLSLSDLETERRRAGSDEVLTQVVSALDLETLRSLPDMSVVVEDTGNVLAFTVSSSKPLLAAQGANAWAAAFLDVRSRDVDSVNSLDDQLGIRLQVAEAAFVAINEPIVALEEQLATSVDEEQAIVSKRISTLTDRVRTPAGILNTEISFLTARLDILRTEAALLARDNSRVITRADSPKASSTLSLARDGVIGSAIGALLGLSIAVLLRTARRRIYNEDDVLAIGLVPIGTFSYRAATRRWDAFATGQDRSRWRRFGRRSELATSLWASLMAPVEVRESSLQPDSIAVGSCERGQDASLVAADLARELTQNHQLVTLIDADLRHAPLDRLLTTDCGRGLVELVSGGATEDEISFPATAAEDLLLIGRGQRAAHPVAVATDQQIGLLLNRDRARRVVMHVGCVGEVPDAAVLAARCDSTVLVARRGLTSRASLIKAFDQVVLAGGTIVGVALVSKRWRR